MDASKLPAGAPNLGLVESEHVLGHVTLRRVWWWAAVIAAGLCSAGGSGLLLFAAGDEGDVEPAYGALALVYFGVLALAAGIWSLRRLDCKARLLICADGLIEERQGHVNHAAWDEIDVYEWITGDAGDTDELKLRCCDGRAFTLEDVVGGFAKLLPAVERGTFERLWHKALQAIQAGEAADFGYLRLSQRGVSKGKAGTGYPVEELPWRDMRDVTCVAAAVVIRRKDKVWPWYSGRVSNHAVCAALLELGRNGRFENP